jgi:hypothetical protein
MFDVLSQGLVLILVLRVAMVELPMIHDEIKLQSYINKLRTF